MNCSSARTLGAILAVALALVAGAGCTSTEAGSAQPESPAPNDSSPDQTAPSPTNTGEESPHAPQVADPIDTSSFETDPCSALSDEHTKDLGLQIPGRNISGGVGPSCRWNYTNELNSFGFTFLTPNKNGLDDIYKRRNEMAYWQPTTIRGYPAVYATDIDQRSEGSCSLNIGISNDLVVATLVSLNDGPDVSDPCPVVAEASEAVITTMKDGS